MRATAPHTSNVNKKVNKAIKTPAPGKLPLFIIMKFHPEFLDLQNFQPKLETELFEIILFQTLPAI